MPWLEPPRDYEVKPGDIIRLRIATGIFGVGSVGPPVWAVERALQYSTWEFRSGAYDGNDLILELEKKPAPGGPDVIEAGAVPAYVVGLLAAAGLGLVVFLVVKDFKVWVDEGGIGFETSTSIPGLVLVAGLGVGFYLLTRGGRA